MICLPDPLEAITMRRTRRVETAARLRCRSEGPVEGHPLGDELRQSRIEQMSNEGFGVGSACTVSCSLAGLLSTGMRVALRVGLRLA